MRVNITKTVLGVVIQGNKKGRELGYPTANISLEKPHEEGIFFGYALIDMTRYLAALFIRDHGSLLEAYILDFSGNLYGQKIRVEIGQKLRNVQKFKNKEDLKRAIQRDVETVRKLAS